VEQKLGQASARVALIKAGCAPPLIVLPFPFAGTIVALALLAWVLIGRLVPRR
jgi:hypothetical protein